MSGPTDQSTRNDLLSYLVYAAERSRHVTEPVSVADNDFRVWKRGFNASGYLRELADRHIWFIDRDHQDFPQQLKSINAAPLGLFFRGRLDLLYTHRPRVAVVGARACSSYGAGVARTFGRELAYRNIIVVSGLARGVDGEAHRGALDANDGNTIAVLGCGIDRDYPAAHAELASRIRKSGVVVSEYPPGTEPAPWRFPARNRIIAGLSDAMVVVEARERSGALIAADLALEEGRDVFAVPGEITSLLSQGTNRLLTQGAHPALSVDEVISIAGLPTKAIEPQSVRHDV